jgi:hypothetical protein
MAKVLVYRFKRYNVGLDDYIEARHWPSTGGDFRPILATREAIAALGGKIIEDPGEEIDDSALTSKGLVRQPGFSDADLLWAVTRQPIV